MTRPPMLDLCCGAGGAAKGYYDAGFDVVGVDINPQPNYPYEFHRGDVLTLGRELLASGRFVAAHTSVPCQGYSGMSECRPGLADEYPRLINPVRTMLQESGLQWVMENVAGSGLPAQNDLFGSFGLLLCGAMFGLKTYRHRLFETSFPVAAPTHPRHLIPASKAGHWKPGTFISVAGNCSPIAVAREVMGIDWMTRAELAESIPPAYSRYIAGHMRAALETLAAA